MEEKISPDMLAVLKHFNDMRSTAEIALRECSNVAAILYKLQPADRVDTDTGVIIRVGNNGEGKKDLI